MKILSTQQLAYKTCYQESLHSPWRIYILRNTFLKANYSYKLNLKIILILQVQIPFFNQLHVITQCCSSTTYCTCLHANHAHHTLPSPTTGSTRRRDACSVIVDKLQIVKADNEKDAISLQVLPDCEHTK